MPTDDMYREAMRRRLLTDDLPRATVGHVYQMETGAYVSVDGITKDAGKALWMSREEAEKDRHG